ncbi:MAG TPA: universal stress protein [Nitrospiria bacterium]|nr:universal stress protein [Nitrospiria bacterium]
MTETKDETKTARPAARINLILVPTDFSELADESVNYAISVAHQLGARILFFHCIERYDNTDPDMFEARRDRALSTLSDLVKRVKNGGMEATADLSDGVPFVEIIRTARKANADLIIMGTHGRTGLTHMLMGSQAERVVRQSSCPVLTVKSAKHQFRMV